MSDPSRRMIIAEGASLAAGAATHSFAADGQATTAPPTATAPASNAPSSDPPAITAANSTGVALASGDPPTDNGSMPNLRFSFADAHVKARDGGSSRQVTQRELPIATSIAGVDMRLTAGGVRELHWHKQAEWSFMLSGHARITAVDNDGRNFIADVEANDLWYFPAGIPHSIQGLGPDGCEFLLAFPDGRFSEDSTFAITDTFAHMPREALAKNFGVGEKAFDRLPEGERFIFQSTLPPPLQTDKVADPKGDVPLTMKFKLMDAPAIASPAGWVRIVDTERFPISTEISAALVIVEPGHMREIHWHPNADEWQYYISGKARMTVFAAEARAHTFEYQAGDVGSVPVSMPHYIENIGTQPLRFLELFAAPRYQDVSLAQWMALTPHELVAAHLDLDTAMLDTLTKSKRPIV